MANEWELIKEIIEILPENSCDKIIQDERTVTRLCVQAVAAEILNLVPITMYVMYSGDGYTARCSNLEDSEIVTNGETRSEAILKFAKFYLQEQNNGK